jgi:hypothetical protein
MTYLTGNIPVGAYDAKRLADLGLGHVAVDGRRLPISIREPGVSF